jgi:hypothetical protein
MQGDPLAELRGIHLPDPISWWPLAPGWWVLIIIFIGGLSWALWQLLKSYNNNLYRRQAMAQLLQIKHDLNLTSTQRLVMILETLKQAVNSAYPDQHFSSRDLAAFLNFLQASCKDTVFQNLPIDLNALLYGRPDDRQEHNELTESIINSSEIWIKQHYAQDKLKEISTC